MSVTHVFDDRPCELGEGPLWHPERQQLYWFDIVGKQLLTRGANGPESWQFDEHVSAAGWVDLDTLLMASESGLWRFDLTDGSRALLVEMEAGNAETRSNDGRADPWGGFWIGTMGKAAQPGAGAIYRYFRGELRKLIPGITIPNAICFSPDRAYAYYTDTVTGKVMRQGLEPDQGWPVGAAEVWLDLTAEALNPDGAVVDAQGNVWIAQWGASRVACYAPDATFLRAQPVDGRHSSCPAFGGADLTTLYCTTAREGLEASVLQAEPENGLTFSAAGVAKGQAEHRVIL